MSVFLDENHLFLRSPYGGVEDVASMQRAGFEAIFCNIGDYPPDSWGVVRERARQVGVVCGPWMRMGDASGFDPQRLEYLLGIADEWDSPVIVNAEVELKGTGGEITYWMSQMCSGTDWALSMEAWPFADVEWWPIPIVLPQIFPQESEPSKDPEGCRNQWYAYGVPCVVFTFGAYHEQPPDTFDRYTPYGVYTADDCGNQFDRWGPEGVRAPCKDSQPQPPGGTVIGDQHGITAAMNRLRDLDPEGTALQKEGDKWPDISTLPPDLSKWKAYDKLQRTLLILKDAHDQGGGSTMSTTEGGEREQAEREAEREVEREVGVETPGGAEVDVDTEKETELEERRRREQEGDDQA